MPRVNCRIIPEPQEETRPIYRKNSTKVEPFIVGKGDIDVFVADVTTLLLKMFRKVKPAADAVSELSIIQRSCVRQAHDLLDNYLNFGSGFSVVQLFLIQ